MRKTLYTLLIACLFMILAFSIFRNRQDSGVYASTAVLDDDRTFTLNALTATDATGRTLPRVSGTKEGKYVGLFYFLWHGQHPADRPRNITELLKTNYSDLFDPSPDNTVVPYGSWLHYQEPLYGYYSSMDEWVMRKHIEMFVAAGVDFLVMDFTNGVAYFSPLTRFMDLLLEYQAAGWNVPKVTFYINVEAQRVTSQVYNLIYRNNKYKNLVFYGNSDKPIIISVPHLLTDNLNEFFDVRASQWYREQYPDTVFPYWTFSRDWEVYTDMVNISIAQTGTAFSFVYESWDGEEHSAWGRGYSTVNPRNGDIDAILRGDNFQEGWDAAIQLDPDIVFITGWNEWVVQKRNLHETFPDLCPYDFPDYTDNFNVEFSRDIEMTKAATYEAGEDGNYIQEGYGDNYYLQLVYNIRRYKGLLTEDAGYKPESVSIDLDGALSQWDQVSARYVSLSTDKIARNADGFYSNTHYTQAQPDNFILDVKVTYDSTNIYFNVRTKENVTAHKEGQTNWMNLFIGVTGKMQGNWESFNYVINRYPISETSTSLEAFTGDNTFTTRKICDIEYRVQGQNILFKIPRADLGLNSSDFGFSFKISDGVNAESDILDYYVSGESFPLGRMALIYETKSGQYTGNENTARQDDSAVPSGNPRNGNAIILAIIIVASAVIIGIEAFVIIVFANKKKKERS